MGSGNPGLTNVLRTMGKKAAAVVLLFDVLKGVISILAVRLFADLIYFIPLYFDYGYKNTGLHYLILWEFGLFSPTNLMWAGALSAVLGHCYPVYYKFKGGKAVLVTVATGLVINWLAALIALCVFIIIVWLTKYVSVGSIIAAIVYPVCVLLVDYRHFYGARYGGFDYLEWGVLHIELFIGFAFSSVISIILIFKHRENIKRLINKTEKKLGEKK
jgi:glycerol-3-phosphate acyltransferase PlsY